MPEATMQIEGGRELQRMIEGLPSSVVSRIMRPLLKQGASILTAAQKSEAPRESGLLAEAIGETDVKKYSGSLLFVTSGVQRGFRRVVKAKRNGSLRFLGKRRSQNEKPGDNFRDPAKYVYPVRKGRSAVVAKSGSVLSNAYTGSVIGKSAAATNPNPYDQRAFSSAQSRVVDLISSGVASGVETEASKSLKL